MSLPQRTIPSTNGQAVSIGCLGYGLMNHTWKPQQSPDEKAFATILYALEAGITFLDAGEFYGPQPANPYANLELLARFFDKYPEWAAPGKCFLSVKGAVTLPEGNYGVPDGTPEGLLRSVDNINKLLGGKKKMDLFQMSRVDPNVPMEQCMATMKGFIEQGKFTHIGLSEVSAATIRKAHAVHPVAAVETEYSMWSLDVEQNGVLATCKELNIPLIAYSPLGRGMLTGSIKKASDIPEGDLRRLLDRFKPENFDQNLKLVDAIQELAKKKGCTSTQLAISWLLSQGVIPIPGSTRVEGIKELLGGVHVKLSEADLKDIRQLVDSAEVIGGRYNAHLGASLAQ